MKNNRKGFTLIELLVVIAIIGLLSTMAVVSLNNARRKSRDAKRVADMKQVQAALELYYNDNNRYPTAVNLTGNVIGISTSGLIICFSQNGLQNNTTGCGTVYMSKVPANPSPVAAGYTSYLYYPRTTAGATGCTNAGGANDCTQYSILFGLEEANSNLGSSAAPCHASSTGLACP